MIPLVLVMTLDLGTWLLVPPDVRAAAESNALVPYISPIILKVGATGTILVLLRRFTTRTPELAIKIVMTITTAGIVSNILGLLW